ncbi:hypothetical protein ABT56_00895 [Photobacterium aquae]|uniref:Uncharacterized protein n=1 Tax=Photobacterium aquae TaxID=1195763 RepID=A0A0J1K334_9GAMM|nr:hypothetical protein [Photobacterium aquae]KLV08817.1 hypothetical protein ABT56_00895 [Photobacterium aquae]
MKLYIIPLVLMMLSMPARADAVLDNLVSLEQRSSELRITAVKCYVQMTLLKQDGWETPACENYKEMATKEGAVLREHLETTTKQFRLKQREGLYDLEQKTQAMELLFSISTHFEGFKMLPAKIESLRRG